MSRPSFCLGEGLCVAGQVRRGGTGRGQEGSGEEGSGKIIG